ncbi:unnamed protein product [Paramecium sonneborni]|uniref:Uncharacterized protein n=1 Tax=Paramecium sonneborni TaxID=65129 RepID=A0A8S1RP80_9CILI|nr:unnamed protein product [Paramecium sonneborni]
MNFSINTEISSSQSTNREEHTIVKEIDSFDRERVRIEKIKIQIKFTSDQKIIYQQNGEILRQVECKDVHEKPELFNNMDQIGNLYWQGQYGKNKKKEGIWIAFWNKKLLNNVGGYYKEGQKQGLWNDLFLNYMNQVQIFETGEYYNGLRIGKWNYIYYCQIDLIIKLFVGGGLYNDNGEKQGKWIELDEGFYDDKKITYCGEYNKNGKKVGIWDIMYSQRIEKVSYKHILKNYKGKYKQIYCGGGSYDQEGNQIKNGKWVELDEKFSYSSQITYYGQYDIYGRKTGKWDIMYCGLDQMKYSQIGGGSYDQKGNQKKIGQWVELIQEFDYWKQITYYGEYNINGMKVGRWNTMYCKYDKKEQKQMQIQIRIFSLVVVDCMMKKEIRKRLESGQNWMKGFLQKKKSLIMENIIQMV